MAFQRASFKFFSTCLLLILPWPGLANSFEAGEVVIDTLLLRRCRGLFDNLQDEIKVRNKLYRLRHHGEQTLDESTKYQQQARQKIGRVEDRLETMLVAINKRILLAEQNLVRGGCPDVNVAEKGFYVVKKGPVSDQDYRQIRLYFE